MIIPVKTPSQDYSIVVERGIIDKCEQYLNLNRKVLIVTDDGVPTAYSDKIMSRCKAPTRVVIPAGEASKSLESFALLLRTMIEHGFTRSDAVVAVGGGVVGDLSGFVASAYMRGVDFYNIPTTLLSQLDSSIGGKCAIDMAGVKNCVGAFWQPRCVLIDPDTLSTLDPRQLCAGLAEAIKMAATSDASLFAELEQANFAKDIENIIIKSIMIKKAVVEADTRESGIRRILNFGHTVGHAIESVSNMSLLHGECVAIGMLYMSSGEAHERIRALLLRAGLPTEHALDPSALAGMILHDKKADADRIHTVYVHTIGSGEIITENTSDFIHKVLGVRA